MDTTCIGAAVLAVIMATLIAWDTWATWREAKKGE
jgi:hypothetical protein